jgi:hypothetical protein
VPTTLGTNTTLNVTLCPAARLSGKDNPLSRNAAFDILACEMLTMLVPRLVKVSRRVFEPPGATVPKFKLVDEGAMGLPALMMPETCWAPAWRDSRVMRIRNPEAHKLVRP